MTTLHGFGSVLGWLLKVSPTKFVAGVWFTLRVYAHPKTLGYSPWTPMLTQKHGTMIIYHEP